MAFRLLNSWLNRSSTSLWIDCELSLYPTFIISRHRICYEHYGSRLRWLGNGVVDLVNISEILASFSRSDTSYKAYMFVDGVNEVFLNMHACAYSFFRSTHTTLQIVPVLRGRVSLRNVFLHVSCTYTTKQSILKILALSPTLLHMIT